jgi:hypothetical protein
MSKDAGWPPTVPVKLTVPFGPGMMAPFSIVAFRVD